jgi:hypothetical protein
MLPSPVGLMRCYIRACGTAPVVAKTRATPAGTAKMKPDTGILPVELSELLSLTIGENPAVGVSSL